MSKKVLIAILARDKEATLPLYLDCIYKLDYPKKDIVLYVRTNNNSDNTEKIIKDFLKEKGSEYSSFVYDRTYINKTLTTHHDWNSERFSVLGKIRQDSLQKALDYKCDYYFVADCDNFILPHTLNSLMRFDVPIVAPFLVTDQSNYYSNFHYEVDDNGYMANNDKYYAVFSRDMKGLFEVKVVHCTYLIKTEYIPKLNYNDGSGRHEYVIFSDSARNNGVKQYIDNTDIYGLITFKTTPDEMSFINSENYKQYIERYPMFGK